MIKGNYLKLILCILISLWSTAGWSNAKVTEIKQVRIWPSPENTRVVFDLSCPIDCQAKSLAHSNRVNLELKNTVFLASLLKLDFQDSRIKHIKTTRINQQDLNIEIELTQSLKPTVFSLAPNQTYGHRLVIDLEIAGNDNGLAYVNVENVRNKINPNERDDILALFEKDSSSTHASPLPGNDRPISGNASAMEATKSVQTPIVNTLNTKAALSPSPVKVLEKKPAPFIIAIDAGHGGEDPGAIGKRGTREKDVALAIAKQLKYLIDREPNMRAVLIRTGDYYIALQERVQRARRHHADLFISIHADAFHDRRAEGASVFTLSEKGASSAAARWLAARENRSDLIGGVKLKDKNKILASVLLDLTQTKSKEEGCKAAHYILRSLGKMSVLHRGQVEQAGFAVLKAPDIPSLLVETGFISNLQGEAKLRNPQYQRQVAQAILNGVRHYVGQRHH